MNAANLLTRHHREAVANLLISFTNHSLIPLFHRETIGETRAAR
jgi:hypothetical protein